MKKTFEWQGKEYIVVNAGATYLVLEDDNFTRVATGILEDGLIYTDDKLIGKIDGCENQSRKIAICLLEDLK